MEIIVFLDMIMMIGDNNFVYKEDMVVLFKCE